MRIEIFTPDYMTKPRPVLTVGDEARSNDPDQRLVDMLFTQAGTDVTATLDANSNLTPPGWYGLYGVDTLGASSVATWVHVS